MLVLGRNGHAAVVGILGAALVAGAFGPADGDELQPVIPQSERGQGDAERAGIHDASNIRTLFWNYGMVGDFPEDPANVDPSVFHSVEVPKGSGMNYGDGITPFVLTRIQQNNGVEAYIMETGFRERQGTSPLHNRDMRFEPRPGFAQADPVRNPARSPAISNDPRTWPDSWPDKRSDPDDPGWPGSWNGFFGKQIVADQESYMVLDDDYYDAWDFDPDSRDLSRRGLGLRVEVRGFQWSNPQARNVIFWLYDITNEGTTDYDEMIFGLYMDSGVGGSALSCEGIYESDDDNAFFDRTFDDQVINLVYTWDEGGHGKDLTSNCGLTGYLGYAYLETPGNSTDALDNDDDGITDERRDGGPGMLLIGKPAIDAYLAANYDVARFEITNGPLEDRPAYRLEKWWTGDEDLDWVAELHDTGADGVFETGDVGEGDLEPTDGEPNFDRTDLNESDQIGLTGFKMNRIRPGQGNPSSEVDDILFFTNQKKWPETLFAKFTDPDSADRYDDAVQTNYNIGFLFASGPFSLKAGQRERFSLALAYGADLNELRGTVRTVQQIYDANYRFAVPPKRPTVTAEAGDGFVRLTWDDVAERSADPVTGEFDFEGYRVYRATDPEFRDPQVITTGTGSGPIGNGRPRAQFDLVNGRSGFSTQSVEGVSYFLGTDSGITHTWTDHGATNGQLYYYAVTAYDHGSDRLDFYPSENSITVSRTARGGTVLPTNVVAVRPNPRVAGYVPASVSAAEHVAGRGLGTVAIEVLNSEIVPDGHAFEITFASPPESLRAATYALRDATSGETLFDAGTDLAGKGVGPVGSGILPIVMTQQAVEIDADRTGFTTASTTDARLTISYPVPGILILPINRRRPGFPDDISIVFSDTVVDTSISGGVGFGAKPAKFQVIAHSPGGDQPLDFQFRDNDGDGTLSLLSDRLNIITYAEPDTARITWLVAFEPGTTAPASPPAAGDVFELVLNRPLASDDVYRFVASAQTIASDTERTQFTPYVVPNPYVGSASFEAERFAVSGRGERRLEFRGLPRSATIRIYTVQGALVRTLAHDGSNEGYVEWDLRSKDNLDIAPGLYVYHVDGGAAGEKTGKFAVIK
ncbi:MAG: hypothetical protein DHS20C21_06190 [Gemmatimonadota bacterium]|nr:MAG: hypothetical protein DHS20C21_06190 [Gemmatimonadota bacterium]